VRAARRGHPPACSPARWPAPGETARGKTSPLLLVGVASSSVADCWVIQHSDLQCGFIRSWGAACVAQLVWRRQTQMLSMAHSVRIAGRLWRPDRFARAVIPTYQRYARPRGDQKAVAALGAGHRCFFGYHRYGHQVRCRDRPEKEVVASEVDVLCLMCRVKLPPRCTGPSVSSACGLQVGLADGAWLVLLA
jgi:hypothetical protein